MLAARLGAMIASALSEVQEEAGMVELVPLLAALGRINAPDGGHNSATR